MPEHTPHSSLSHSLGMHQDVKSCKRQMQHATCSLRQLSVVLKLLPSFRKRAGERENFLAHHIHNRNVCPKIVREVCRKSFPLELVNFQLTGEMHSKMEMKTKTRATHGQQMCGPHPLPHHNFPPEIMFIIRRRQTVFNLSIYDTVGWKLFLVARRYYIK